MGLKDLDASLIKTPIIGPIYEAWFRKETYYRHDTRLMYCDTVNAVVKAKVEDTTGAKAAKPDAKAPAKRRKMSAAAKAKIAAAAKARWSKAKAEGKKSL